MVVPSWRYQSSICRNSYTYCWLQLGREQCGLSSKQHQLAPIAEHCPPICYRRGSFWSRPIDRLNLEQARSDQARQASTSTKLEADNAAWPSSLGSLERSSHWRLLGLITAPVHPTPTPGVALSDVDLKHLLLACSMSCRLGFYVLQTRVLIKRDRLI